MLFCAMVLFLGAGRDIHARETAGGTFLIFPFQVIPVEKDDRWISPALTESLKLALQRLGLENIDEPLKGLVMPDPPSELTNNQLKEWLGEDWSDKTDLVVFGQAEFTDDQALLRLYPYDLARDRPGEIYEASGSRIQLPTLASGLTDHLFEYSRVNASGRYKDEVLAAFTDSFDAFRYFGQSYLLDDLTAQVEKLQEVVEVDPYYTTAWMQLGLTMYSADKKEEARDAFIRVIQLSPGFREAHNNLGVVLAEINQTEEAAEAFRQALKVDDQYLDARFNLAKLLDKARKNDEALKEYEVLLREDPENTDVRFLMALILDRSGDPAGALEEFRRLSSKDPSKAEGFFTVKGRDARQNKDYRTAELFFKRALDINPRFAEAYKELGVNSFMSGDYEESVGYFLAAAEKLPDSAETRHYLGLALDKNGRRGEALEAFRKAVDLENFKASILELGRIYLEEKRYPDAIIFLERYLRVDPENEEGKALLARATEKAREESDLIRQKAEFATQRLVKMEEIISDLNRKNAELETGLAIAIERSLEMEAQADQLREDKNTLELEYAQLSQDASDQQRKLQEELQELETSHSEKLATLEEKHHGEGKDDTAKDILNKLKEDRSSLEKELQSVKEEKDSLFRQLEESLQELAETEESWQTEYDSLLEARRSVTEEIEGIKEASGSRVKELEALLEKERADRREAMKKAGTLADREEELSAGLETVSAERDQLRTDLSSAAEDKESLEKALSDREEELVRAGKDLKEAEVAWRARYDDLQQKILLQNEEMENIREGTLNRVKELKALLEKEKAGRREAEKKSETLADREEELTARLQELSAELEAVSAERRRLREDLSTLHGEKGEMENFAVTRITEMEKRLKGLQGELSSTRLSLQKKEEELKRRSKEITAVKNDFVNHLGELAVYHHRAGTRQKALELYLLMVEYDPGAGSAYLGLGEIYLEMGEYQKSEEMFRKAAEHFRE
jgi:tetratricopeptide (TPR) repeat protein